MLRVTLLWALLLRHSLTDSVTHSPTSKRDDSNIEQVDDVTPLLKLSFIKKCRFV